MYRPENWKNPWTEVKLHEQYEAGADAMLRALRELGEHFPAGFTTINFPSKMPAGYYVLIPDEEVVNELDD